jgi:DNA-binding NarL/FixJ family response regulator
VTLASPDGAARSVRVPRGTAPPAQEGRAIGERIPLYISASDPVSKAGVAGQLRHRPEIDLLDDDGMHRAVVAIVAGDEVDDDIIRTIRVLQRGGCSRVVLVVTRLDDRAMLAAVEAGVRGLVRRSEATPERLVGAVQAALVGDGAVPPDLLGRLLNQIGNLQRDLLAPRGLTFTGLTQRELAVLRLVAAGYSTNEIAKRLAFSERTVKNAIHDVTTRLQLRNRSHAVAYAVRQGLI